MNRIAIVKSCLIAISVVSLIGVSCASKKFVNNRLTPLDNRVQSLESESTTAKGERAVAKDERDEIRNAASRADEKAVTADSKAVAAREQAESALRLAGDANGLAIKNLADLDETDRRISSLDDFEASGSATVLFGFDSSSLTGDEQRKLDEFASRVAPGDPYIVEIQGFTDRTGSMSHNLELSRRRAESVARYLTSEHQIPLRRLHIIGLGSENLAGDNSTREGRKLSRRVEVRLFTRETLATAQRAQ